MQAELGVVAVWLWLCIGVAIGVFVTVIWQMARKPKGADIVIERGVRVRVLKKCGFGEVGQVITVSAPTARYGVDNGSLAFTNDIVQGRAV